MNTKDFSFFYRKEFLFFCCLLVLVTFSQIALEEQIITRINRITPFLVLNFPFFEMLGLLLPLFTCLFFFTYIIVTRKEYSGLPPLKWIIPFVILLFMLASVPLPEIEDEIIIEDPTSTIPTTNIPHTGTTSPNTVPPATYNPQTYKIEPYLVDILQLFMLEFRNIFLLVIFILTITFLIFLRRQSKQKDAKKDENEKIRWVSTEKEQKAKTILECYYQASTSLEERGANDSPSFTPPEFTDDVTSKKLCPKSSIHNLSDLFEEAKFSNHLMTEENVKDARKLSHSIIFSPELISDEDESSAEESEG
ncbi:MAG: DUF4129 domain-containing protein [Candidatus Hodarchaeota archaeon]